MLGSEDECGCHRITTYTNSLEEDVSMKFQNQPTPIEGKEDTTFLVSENEQRLIQIRKA